MKQVIIKMDDEVHRKLKLLCAEYKVTMKRFIENAINADFATGEFITRMAAIVDKDALETERSKSS